MDSELNKNIITLPEDARIYLDELREEEKEPIKEEPKEYVVIR